MTTIRRIHEALVGVLTDYGHGLQPSADPFSFDYDARPSDAWYVGPPSTRSEGAVGGVQHVEATITVWVSRDAGQDAAAAALDVADDLAHLRHLVAGLDVDPDGLVNVDPRMTTTVQPRPEGAVTVVGRLAVGLDYEADAESP